jgi:hypothetical protein
MRVLLFEISMTKIHFNMFFSFNFCPNCHNFIINIFIFYRLDKEQYSLIHVSLFYFIINTGTISLFLSYIFYTVSKLSTFKCKIARNKPNIGLPYI